MLLTIKKILVIREEGTWGPEPFGSVSGQVYASTAKNPKPLFPCKRFYPWNAIQLVGVEWSIFYAVDWNNGPLQKPC